MSEASAGVVDLFDRTRVPLDVRPAPQQTYPWYQLDFDMKHQSQTNWCWAATAASVVQFFQPDTTWTQCLVVCEQLGKETCCDNKAACNQTGKLGLALQTVDCWVEYFPNSVPYDDVVNQIANKGAPVCPRILWSDDSAHFVAITGAGEPDYLVVDDSWYGQSFTSWEMLCVSYQGTGRWVETQYTAPPSPAEGGDDNADSPA